MGAPPCELRYAGAPVDEPEASPMVRSDEDLLACILAEPALVAEVPEDEVFASPAVAELVRAAREMAPRDGDPRESTEHCPARPRDGR